MANINSTWRKFVALGCSHGHLADKKAVRGALKFCQDYKPATRLHLGDFLDTAAFRSGAKGGKDESVSCSDDLSAGLRFLENYAPTHLLIGNHDERLYSHAHHPNAIVSRAAISMIDELKSLVNKLGCDYRETYSIRDPKARIRIGDMDCLHGWFYNVMAARDHAESFGKCMFVHTHTIATGVARNAASSVGYNIGSLANFDALDYALRRRQTLAWRAGLAFGEYNHRETRVWVAEADDQGYFHAPRI